MFGVYRRNGDVLFKQKGTYQKSVLSYLFGLVITWLQYKNQNCFHGTDTLYNCNPLRPTPHLSLRDIIETLRRHLDIKVFYSNFFVCV